MRVETVDAYDDAGHLDWYGPQAAAERHDWPDEPGWTNEELAARNRDNSAGDAVLAVARGNGGVLGSVSVWLPRLDNTDTADMWLAVRPEARRRGVGAALLEFVETEAIKRGRSKLVARTETPLGDAQHAGERFAAHHGFERALAEERRVLQLPPEPGSLERLEADLGGFATDYEIRSWRGACPAELLDARARLFRAISTDAPHGNLEREEESWDAERVRRNEKTAEEMGRDVYSAGAVHRETGELVAVTDLSVPRDKPATSYQLDTVVETAHRGHRLGTLVKVANLRQLLDGAPEVRRVITWNAADNEHMVRVNEALGFRLIGVSGVWMKRLG